MTTSDSMTQPGWRDFERAVAAAFGGKAQESKYIFDVIIPQLDQADLQVGISCKMRGELNRIIERDGRITSRIVEFGEKVLGLSRKERVKQSQL